MDVVFDRELKSIRETAERFTAREIIPGLLHRDGYPFYAFDRKIVRSAATIGLLTPTLPEACGGPGLGYRVLAEILESVAIEDASMAMIVFTQSLAHHFLAAATDPQIFAASVDPEVGRMLALPVYHDPDDLPGDVEVSPENQGYVLFGHLDYVAGLPEAEAILVPAVFEGAIFFFLVRADDPGVAVGEPVVGLGLRSCPAADLKMDGVAVPPDRRLKSEAAKIYADLANRYRGPLAALVHGLLRGCYRTSLEYARDRYQAKKYIIEHDMIRRMLAEMKAWLDIGSPAIKKICEQLDLGPDPHGSALLSLHELVTRAAVRSTADGVQVLGGYGYMKEYGQEKRMRDARQLQAVFGCSAVRTLRILESDSPISGKR